MRDQAGGVERLLLVRHADAGAKHVWAGRDAERPLDRLGRLQAAALVGLLAGYPVARVVSSPAVRCVQTVEPLARHRKLGIEPCADLGAGAGVEAALGLLRRLARDAAVVCTHGEVIEAVLGRLTATGLTVAGGAGPGGPPLAKGSTWVIDGLDRGAPLGRYLPPGP